MRVTRVYTRTGDGGETGLATGERVSKASLRIGAFGSVDELNSVLGACAEALGDLPADASSRAAPLLSALQQDLFQLGGDLATPEGSRWPGMTLLGEDDVRALETCIDRFQEDLLPLREFVLPGGSEAGALLHIARTVCRRAEREIVAMSLAEAVNPFAVKYVNRLSDLLFVLSRWVVCKAGKAEVLWSKSEGILAYLKAQDPS